MRLYDTVPTKCYASALFLAMLGSLLIYTTNQRQAGARNVLELSLEALRRHFLLEHSRVLGRLSEGLLAQVLRDRQGETVDGPMLRSLLRCLDATSLYEPRFQVPLLDASQLFFAAEGARMVGNVDTGGGDGGLSSSTTISSSSSSGSSSGHGSSREGSSSSSSSGLEESGRRAAQFLSHVERRLSQVSQQCESYLAPSSKRPLLHCVEQKLLAPYLPVVLDANGGGFDALLQQVVLVSLMTGKHRCTIE